MAAKELHDKFVFALIGSEGLNITLKLLGNEISKII